jgi:CBS domain-containing protein
MLAEKEIGALLVLDGEKVVGIFSERDYARKVILQGKSSANTTVSELMIRDVIYASPDDSIQESMAILTENKIRHLPIIEDGKLCGMVTSGDIINHIISRQKFEIEALKKYITGGY